MTTPETSLRCLNCGGPLTLRQGEALSFETTATFDRDGALVGYDQTGGICSSCKGRGFVVHPDVTGAMVDRYGNLRLYRRRLLFIDSVRAYYPAAEWRSFSMMPDGTATVTLYAR